MKRVYIYCEGQTEESFTNNVLYPYFSILDICVIPIICETKRTAQKKFRGGVSDYGKINRELTKLCKKHRNEIVTTMFDYYAMPDNTPQIHCAEPDLYRRIERIEAAVKADIDGGNCKFKFNFMLHEFEGILFSEPQAFRTIADDATVHKIQEIRDAVQTPEQINQSPETAPSKRLDALIHGYTHAKVKNGTLVSTEIGIHKIMSECPHFRQWIEWIRQA